MSVVLIIIGLVLFVGLVVLHEYGHFIAARKSDIDVEEFGIGFPPRALKLGKRNGTLYTLNWLPLGGFVRLKGEHDADKSPGTFGAAPLKSKVLVMLAGVGMNLLTAFVLLTLLALVGLPKLLDDQFTVASDTKVTRQQVLVGYVEPGSPAEKAGIQTRDELVSMTVHRVPPQKIDSQEALPKLTKQYAGQQVTVMIKRGGQELQKPLTLRSTQEVEASKKTSEPKGYLGVSPSEYTLRRSTWSAPIVALGFMKQLTVMTFKGLGTAIAGIAHGNGKQASEQVSGPVGVFVVVQQGSFLGYQFVLLIIAVISLSLAIMNVLPIPALDGGRLFVTLVFRALRKPLTAKREDMIHGTGFAVLMLLFVLITIVDIKRFF